MSLYVKKAVLNLKNQLEGKVEYADSLPMIKNLGALINRNLNWTASS